MPKKTTSVTSSLIKSSSLLVAGFPIAFIIQLPETREQVAVRNAKLVANTEPADEPVFLQTCLHAIRASFASVHSPPKYIWTDEHLPQRYIRTDEHTNVRL